MPEKICNKTYTVFRTTSILYAPTMLCNISHDLPNQNQVILSINVFVCTPLHSQNQQNISETFSMLQ